MAEIRRTALVTGASRGIGRAIARALAARGVRIAVHYHSTAEAAEEARAQLAGGGHLLCKADLLDGAAAARLWHDAVEAVGHIDILVNNAGLFFDHPPLTTDFAAWEAAWRDTLAANLLGPANLSVLAAQAMAARPPLPDDAWGRGRIVNISSRGAFRGEPDAPAYGASKAGLNSLSQSLAKALAAHRIYVYCLAPGFVATDMVADLLASPAGADIVAQNPLGRVAMPEEVAQAAAFCALDAPAAMTGSIIDVNGASYLRT
ncbi:MAG: short-chain dehydrogenase/reductase [Gammaproteobacteria bacterium]|nr:short-chain dehydrogenase/reductase [Gammaproteobacteria bacterium]